MIKKGGMEGDRHKEKRKRKDKWKEGRKECMKKGRRWKERK